jgi:hypothetical protein
VLSVEFGAPLGRAHDGAPGVAMVASFSEVH